MSAERRRYVGVRLRHRADVVRLRPAYGRRMSTQQRVPEIDLTAIGEVPDP